MAVLTDWEWPKSGDASSFTCADWRDVAAMAAKALFELLGSDIRLDSGNEGFDGGFCLEIGVGARHSFDVDWRGVFGGS